MRKPIALLLCLIVASSSPLIPSASTQSPRRFIKIAKRALSRLPSETHARLIERLEGFIGGLEDGAFGDVYDIMPESCKDGLSREEWLKSLKFTPPGHLKRFRIDDVMDVEDNAPNIYYGKKWIVQGCQTYQKGKETLSYQFEYDGWFLAGEWYFCEGGILVRGEAREPQTCSE